MGFYSYMPDENMITDKILKWIVDLLTVLVLAFFFMYFLCNQTTVVGNSMNKILQNGDRVMVNEFSYRLGDPDRYDVVLFEKTNSDGSKDEYIKRIVGLPGETVQIKNGRIYVNGKKIKCDYIKDDIVNAGLASDEVKLEYNEYFVIGDNANNSEDSRFSTVMNVKESEIKGKVWLISWPFARIRPVN